MTTEEQRRKKRERDRERQRERRRNATEEQRQVERERNRERRKNSIEEYLAGKRERQREIRRSGTEEQRQRETERRRQRAENMSGTFCLIVLKFVIYISLNFSRLLRLNLYVIGNNFVRPNNLHLTFLYFILQMNKGKEIAIDTENGEGIYANNSMKLELRCSGKIKFRALAKFV